MSYDNTEPLYLQVQRILTENINIGIWPVHSKIPDEITLAEQLKVSRGTLRKALHSMIEQGMLKQLRGKGTFVVARQAEHPLASSLISLSESMKDQGLEYKTLVLKKMVFVPTLKVAALLELEPSEKVTFIERVRLVDNFPVAYLKNYVPVKYCSDLVHDDLESTPLFDLIENKYHHKIKWGRRYFKAVPAFGEIVQNLGLDVGAPAMQLEQITYREDSVPLECSFVWINSERFEIVSILQR